MVREALWLLSNWIDNGIKRHRINQNRTLLAEIRQHDSDIIAKCKRLILDSVNTFQLRAFGPRKRPKKLGMYYKQVINRLGVMRAAIMTTAMVNKTKAKWSAAEFSGGTHRPVMESFPYHLIASSILLVMPALSFSVGRESGLRLGCRKNKKK